MDLNDFNLIMETNNPAKKLSFQWSIKRIKKLPGKITSNKFSLVSGQPQDWQMTIFMSTASRFHVSLTYGAAKDADPVRVHHLSRILKSNGVVLVRYTPNSNVYHGGEQCLLLLDTPLPQHEEEKIIFDCTMTVYGYGLDTTCDLYNDDNAPNLDLEDLQNGYRKMMESDKFADVKIQIGKSFFSAHKCILKYQSPTFFRLYKEKILEGKVVLHDIEPHVFEIVLEYIYSMKTNELPIINNCAEVYPVAVMFDLKGLQAVCSKDMVFGLRPGNVCDYYQLAESHSDEELLKHCKIFMKANLFLMQNEGRWSTFIASKPHLEKEITEN